MASQTQPGLSSVIIVAADSGVVTRECVARVLDSQAAVEVILVDNASADGEPAHIAAAHANDTRFRVLRNDRNFGFGPACNRGAALAAGDALVFLNPDCLIRTDTLRDVRAAMARHVDLGVLGIHVLQPDGLPEPAVRRREPNLRRALATLSGLARLGWGGMRDQGVHQVPARAPGTHEAVDAVSGAFIAMPRHSFEQLGGFDERYFLHCEDLDLCRRARDAGLAVILANDIVVQHVQGTSSRHRPVFVAWHKHRGMWRYFSKFDPAARSPLLRGFVYCGIWTRFGALALLLWLRGLLR